MASTPIFPFAPWVSGTNQNSVPSNDNSRRNQLLNGNIISQVVTAQPASPTEGDAYIINATHTGAQWAGFTPKDLAIYSGGTWYAFAPVEGARVSISGAIYIYTSGSWTLWSGGVGGDMLSPLLASETAVTTTATLTLSRQHVCSGTTADYTVTLPAASGNAGKFVGVRMAAGLTRWVTVKGNASELIDGVNTRLMWAKESAILMCDGTGWTKVSGRSVPIRCDMRTNGAQTAMTAAVWNRVPMVTVVTDNTSALAVPAGDTTNGRVRVLRPGSYNAAGFCTGENFAAGKTFAAGAVNSTGSSFDPNGSPNMWGAMMAQAAASLMHAGGSGTFEAAASTFFYVTAYNGDTVSRNTTAATATIQPTLSVTEIPNW